MLNVSAEVNVQFPVAELGGCGSKEECRSYCDEPGNTKICLDFAEKNGLMSDQELSEARKFVAAGGKGPGGCSSKNSCEAFCNDISNMKECIAFAEKSGMMSGAELEEAKKVMQALESGATLPGGCKNKEECDAYCGGGSADRMKECIAFAKAAGFMSDEELREVDKIMGALEKGVKPPNCRGDEECAIYCADNVEECIEFGLASGMMTEENAVMLRKTGGRGPGGCLGRACESFCDNPANQEACTNYAREQGMISDDDYQKMTEGRDRFKNDFSSMPSSVRDCLRSSIGSELDKMLAGNPPSPESRDKMNACFSQMGPPPGSQSGTPSGGDDYNRPPEGIYVPPGGHDGASPTDQYRAGSEPERFEGYGGTYQPPANITEPPEGYVAPSQDGSSIDSRVPSTSDQPLPVGPESAPSTEGSEPTSYAGEQGMAALISIFLGVFR